MLVVTLGARTVEGAIVAGLALALFPELLKALGISPEYQFILFGLGALTYAQHPEGILEAQKRQVIGRDPAASSIDATRRSSRPGDAPREDADARRASPSRTGATESVAT